ncbi:amino acid ABC transporter ATP-binding protein [Microbacterium sp. zg.B48]|uniref:amino acid ABC transporter ATP-binding protein n=1 Tax=Microbacterium sp. zg.B48 TaxID=2969408 RepID=UPI00214C2E48|nr:amino acid ABC transporter ATP-binding protein [Microbacterium sp. zg.B48]MCR2762480.1 amino acid ABC transporter ATP-binding protein [Microbacterium sp. zg.B48]
MIDVVNVSKSYGEVCALKNVSLKVDKGDVLCIVGRSGSGKSTLLRCLNQLEGIDDGLIFFNGEIQGYTQRGGALSEMTERKKAMQRTKFAMVFQSFGLFPHLTVMENLTIGPRKVLGKKVGKELSDYRDLLAQVGLSDKADSYPRFLSGGQQQRVAIARALAMRPEVLLFDEPTSALDPELVGEVVDSIKALAHSGITMILVTHEIRMARDIATKVAFMDKGEVVAFGTSDEVFNANSDERLHVFIDALN